MLGLKGVMIKRHCTMPSFLLHITFLNGLVGSFFIANYFLFHNPSLKLALWANSGVYIICLYSKHLFPELKMTLDNF